MPKVAEARKRFPTLDIEVDGGLDAKTIVDATIIEQYLPWLILVLLLNFKRQKKPVVYLLISF